MKKTLILLVLIGATTAGVAQSKLKKIEQPHSVEVEAAELASLAELSSLAEMASLAELGSLAELSQLAELSSLAELGALSSLSALSGMSMDINAEVLSSLEGLDVELEGLDEELETMLEELGDLSDLSTITIDLDDDDMQVIDKEELKKLIRESLKQKKDD